MTKSLHRILALLPALFCLNTYVSATSTTSATARTNIPSCFQPRATTDPAAPSIASAIASASAVSKACDQTLECAVTSGSETIVFYSIGAYYFNISYGIPTSTTASLMPTARSASPAFFCPAQFQDIVDVCVKRSFWGGWIEAYGANWSVSNSFYPQIPLLLLSQSGSSSLSSFGTIPSGTSKTGRETNSGTRTFTFTVNSSSLSHEPSVTTGLTGSMSSGVTGSGSDPRITKPINKSTSSIISTMTQSPANALRTTDTVLSELSRLSRSVASSLTNIQRTPWTYTGTPSLTDSGTSQSRNSKTPLPTHSRIPSLPKSVSQATFSASSSQSDLTTSTGRSGASRISFSFGSSYVSKASRPTSATSNFQIDTPTAHSDPSTTMLQGDTGPSQPATFSSRSPESTGSVSITLDDSNQQWGTLPASLTSLAAVAKSFTETIGPTTIVPDYTVTNAFPAGITQTTLRESNGAILIYSISTFADQATITGAPIPIWTTVDQTDSNGHHTRFVGLIWVGAGGRYWGPPGIPKIEIGGGPHFHHIKPLCLAPFCSGKESENGVGGGAPGGTSPPAEETPEEEEENEREEEEEEEEKTKEEQKTEEKQTKSKEEKTETEEGQTKTEDKQTSTELGKSSAIYSSTISVSAVHSSTASVSANGTITLLDGDFTYSLMPYTEALEYASSAQALIDGISIPDGPLWVPTGSEELALTATASDSDGDFPWPGFIIPPGRNRLSTITSAISLSSATVKNTVATATRDSTHSSFLTGTRATGDLSLPISTAKTLATTGRDSTHHSFSNSATAKTITKAGLSLLSGDDFPTLDIHLYKPIPVGRSVLTLEPYTPPAPAPTPAPPPSPPPPPPPTPSVAVLMWREDSCGDLASGCDSAVRVYDIPAADQSMNPCKPSDYTVIYKVVYKSYVGNDESDYVITVGPFTTHGVKGVRYSGSNLHVGRLTGDGLPGGVVQCGESSRDVVSCSSSHSLDQDDMIPVFYCEW